MGLTTEIFCSRFSEYWPRKYGKTKPLNSAASIAAKSPKAIIMKAKVDNFHLSESISIKLRNGAVPKGGSVFLGFVVYSYLFVSLSISFIISIVFKETVITFWIREIIISLCSIYL